MKKIILTTLWVMLATSVFGQSRSVERFRQTHKPESTYFFYKSTLRMFARFSMQLAQADERNAGQEAPDLTGLIGGINKIKFFIYEQDQISSELFDALEEDVTGEDYQSVMTARMQGSNINMLMKESRSNKPEGFVILIRNERGFTLIDVDGVPDIGNLMELTKYMNSNTDSFSLLEAFR